MIGFLVLPLPQLSIEETQDHDLDAPTNLDNIRQTDPIPVNPSIGILIIFVFNRHYK